MLKIASIRWWSSMESHQSRNQIRQNYACDDGHGRLSNSLVDSEPPTQRHTVSRLPFLNALKLSRDKNHGR